MFCEFVIGFINVLNDIVCRCNCQGQLFFLKLPEYFFTAVKHSEAQSHDPHIDY